MIRWFEKKRIFSITLVIIIAIEIFFFSSISGGVSSPGTSLKVSMIYHFSVFFLLNFFLLISLNGNKNVKIKYLIVALIFSVIYSIMDELHQLFVPFRYADFMDIMMNNIGIFSSTLTYFYYKGFNQ